MFRKLQVVQHRRASDLLDARVGRDGRTGFSRRFGHRSASDLVVPIENQQRRAGVVGDALASSKRSGKSTGLLLASYAAAYALRQRVMLIRLVIGRAEENRPEQIR